MDQEAPGVEAWLERGPEQGARSNSSTGFDGVEVSVFELWPVFLPVNVVIMSDQRLDVMKDVTEQRLLPDPTAGTPIRSLCRSRQATDRSGKRAPSPDLSELLSTWPPGKVGL